MSAYDPTGRKPPLSSNTISQPQQTYSDYNIGSTQQQQLSSNVETIILSVIPNGLNRVDQIACIILSSDGTERESFSLKFDEMNNPFENQADYLADRLNGAQWFATDQYDIQQILDTQFSALNKSSPRPLRLINATQYFNDYKINQSKINSVIGATNARIGCSNIYSLLISISISNSLSALSTNAMPTQTIQPVIQSPNDYNTTPTQPQDTFNNNLQSSYDANNNNNNAINNTNFNDNTQISQKTNDYQANTIQNIPVDTNNNNDPQRNNYNNTQFNEQNDNNVINDSSINETQPVDNNTNDMNIINNNITSNEQQYNEPINNDNNNGHYQQQSPMDVINNNNEEIQQQQPVQNEQILNEPKQEEPEQSQMIQQPEIQSPPQQQQVSNTITATNDISEELESSQKENVEQNIQQTTPTVTATDNTSTVMESSLSPSSAQQEQQPQQSTSALSKKSSWASKFRKGPASPKRKQLGVIDRVSDNIYKSGGKGKLSATTTRDGIRNSIADAITKNKEGKKSHVIWVSYAGHQKPFIPRGIKPIGWDQRSSKGGRDASFFAIQHKAKSQNQQKFYLKNVLEVRRTAWRIPANELAQLQRKYPTATAYQYNNQNNYYNNQNDGNNYNQRQGGYRQNYGNQNRGNNQNRRSNQRGGGGGNNNYNNSNQGGSNTGNQQNNQSGNK